jgi:hypothetical protein
MGVDLIMFLLWFIGEDGLDEIMAAPNESFSFST